MILLIGRKVTIYFFLLELLRKPIERLQSYSLVLTVSHFNHYSFSLLSSFLPFYFPFFCFSLSYIIWSLLCSLLSYFSSFYFSHSLLFLLLVSFFLISLPSLSLFAFFLSFSSFFLYLPFLFGFLWQDLCQHTPEAHKDFSVLKQSLNVMSDFIASTHDPRAFQQVYTFLCTLFL